MKDGSQPDAHRSKEKQEKQVTHALLVGGFKSVIEAAKRLGVRLTVVDRPGKLVKGMDALVERVIITDYATDAALLPLILQIHDIDPIDTVLSFTEPGLLLAAKISEALQIAPSVPTRVVEQTRSKVQMREALGQVGLEVPFAAVSSQADLDGFIKRFGAPAILKPESGVGSYGVIKVNAARETASAFGTATQRGDTSWVVERFLSGPEFSVEAFSFDGNHIVLSVHAKDKAGDGSPNPFVEVGHSGPASLSPEEWKAMSDVVARCLDSVGYSDGPSHTEVILTRNGPEIVETHTRVGGGRIFHLLKLSTGIDVYELAVNWMCLRSGRIDQEPQRRAAAAIRFIVGKAGRLSSVGGVEEARKIPGCVEVVIYKGEGDIVPELQGSDDRIGHVICTGRTSEQAQHLCDHIVRKVIHLEIDALQSSSPCLVSPS